MCPSHRFGAPTAAVAHICAVEVLDVYLVDHFGVLLLDLQVDQAVPLLLLLGQEGPDGQVAQQCQDAQQRQQPEPLGHWKGEGDVTSLWVELNILINEGVNFSFQKLWLSDYIKKIILAGGGSTLLGTKKRDLWMHLLSSVTSTTILGVQAMAGNSLR